MMVGRKFLLPILAALISSVFGGKGKITDIFHRSRHGTTSSPEPTQSVDEAGKGKITGMFHRAHHETTSSPKPTQSVDDAIREDADWITNPDEQTGNVHLHVLIQNGEFQDAIKLIEANKGINVPNRRKETAVFFAVLEGGKGNTGAFDVMVKLIEMEVPLNIFNVDDSTPLDIAAEMGNNRMVNMLLNGGADMHCKQDPNIVGRKGMCPLMRAVVNNHVQVVWTLLSSGANPEFHGDAALTEYFGMSPLDAAVYKVHEEIVQLLVDHKDVNVHHVGIDGTILLHLVVQVKDDHLEEGKKTRVSNSDLSKEQVQSLGRIVDLIVGKECDPVDPAAADAENKRGTALNFAIVSGDHVAFNLFVKRIEKEFAESKRGPWMNLLTVENRYGRRPLEEAYERKAQTMAQVLEGLNACCSVLLIPSGKDRSYLL